MNDSQTLNDAFLPEGFRERMKQMLGDEYDDFIRSYTKPKHPALRANPLKLPDISEDAVRRVLPFPLDPVPWVREGFLYPESEDVRPGRHLYHEAGLYYIQEASAMIPASLCPPVPGDRVLDLCAAPGGKATQAAAALRGKGLLVANEIVASRASILSRNIERMGIPNAVVTNESPDALADRFPAFFDKIIVDAPCSGEGMFRKEEQALTMWNQGNVDLCAARQREILTKADRMLAPGGYLTYSTCTFAPEENEETLAWFLAAHPGYTVETPKNPLIADCIVRGLLDAGRPDWVKNVQVDDDLADMIRKSIRLFPHHSDGEGHFAVLLRKTEDSAAVVIDGKRPDAKKKNKSGASGKQDVSVDKAYAAFRTFCRDVIGYELSGSPCLFGDTLYLLPDSCGITPDTLKGLHVLRAGLQTGTASDGRFEPSHALALALDAARTEKVFPLDPEAGQDTAYLRGEVIPCPVSYKSWYLIMLNGFSIGWGKASGGMMKNHYPKGLRKP
ncbi:MAG: RsmB/NOP family class I SAM-dependent RNA methyltransferase [Clostridia bacterium]|nr:RsmB/NOP family class I SAM-dependent RNA methyltransferase [Clostridia bacterium]